MDENEKKAFIISLAVALGAAVAATVIGYYAYKKYTQTNFHPNV